MITRLEIRNFKSLRNVTLDLGSMNLFVGANASGKSNFFDALRVLQGIGNGFTVSEILDGKRRARRAKCGKGFAGEVRRRVSKGRRRKSCSRLPWTAHWIQ